MHWWTAATALPVEHVRDVMGPLGEPERPGGFGQPFKRIHESGAAVYCGSDRPGQPLVINAPGEVCEGWSNELVTWTRSLGAWCTRVDLALDVEPPDLARRRLREMRRDFNAGRVNTTFRGKAEFHSSEEGETLYLGGKSAELRIRIYDRRGPLRIEPQWRPSRRMGEQVPELLATKGATHVWRALAARAEFTAPWYQDLLHGELPKIETEPRFDPAFLEGMQQLWKQFGLTFWAWNLLGVQLEDVQRVPKKLRGSQAAKFRAWADAATKLGYDGDALKREISKLCDTK